jgi:peptidoglycan/LPS O-acetylase OafA/YrhL
VAVLAVVLSHVLGWPRGGFAGVDVFFVVSGFLITGLLLREIAATGTISLRDFYARRIRRILPAALLVLAAVAVASFFVFNRARADQTLGDAVAAFLLVANWRFAAEGTDYFHAADAVSPLQHFWSLSVEEQFYLVWPGLLLLLVLLLPLAARQGRSARAVVGAAALVVVVASTAWAFAQTASEPTVAYFSTATRAWELGVGALLAAASPLLARLPAALRWPLGWAGLAGVLWSFFLLDPDTMPFPAPWALLPVGAAALVIAAGVGGDPRQRQLFPLSNPLSVFVGDLSYSLYLWHFPVLVFAAVLLPPGATTTPLVLVATAVLTLAAYFGVEQPLHRSPWLRRRPTATAGVDETDAVASATAETPALAAPEATPAPAPAPPAASALAVSTRPAGWVPGARYYPGSRPRTASPAALPQAPAPAPEPRALEPLRPASVPHPLPSGSADDAPAPRPWAQWRARFGAQMGLSAAGLGIGAGVIVLLVFTTFGTPTLSPLLPQPAPEAAAPVDPTGEVQAELAAAVSATTWPDLHPSLDEVIAQSSGANPAHDCFSPDAPIELARCTWGSPDAAHHMYLVGDSSAMAYAPAFKKIAEESGGAWRITTVGLYGCRFTDVLVENSGAGVMSACPQRKVDVRAMVGADPADLVVVSNAYTLGHTVDGRDLTAAELLAATQAEMAGYGAAGRIVYLAPPPKGGALSTCYSPLSSPANCLTAVDQTWHDMASAAEAAAAASGDHAIDSRPFTCSQDVCPAFAGDVPIRYDENHFTVAYAEHIAPVLRWQLSATGLFSP